MKDIISQFQTDNLNPHRDKKENFTLKAFNYLMTRRPPSIGTHPMGLIKDPEEVLINNRLAYRITYGEPLSVEQLERFELSKEFNNSAKGLTFKVGRFIHFVESVCLNEVVVSTTVDHPKVKKVLKSTYTQLGFTRFLIRSKQSINK
jgi:hypothetical protein